MIVRLLTDAKSGQSFRNNIAILTDLQKYGILVLKS